MVDSSVGEPDFALHQPVILSCKVDNTYAASTKKGHPGINRSEIAFVVQFCQRSVSAVLALKKKKKHAVNAIQCQLLAVVARKNRPHTTALVD